MSKLYILAGYEIFDMGKATYRSSLKYWTGYALIDHFDSDLVRTYNSEEELYLREKDILKEYSKRTWVLEPYELYSVVFDNKRKR